MYSSVFLLVSLFGARQQLKYDDGDDTLVNAMQGSVVYGRAGADTFYFGRNYLIVDADADDRVYYHGYRLTGAARNANSESEWTYGKFGERYAITTQSGELAAVNDNHKSHQLKVA